MDFLYTADRERYRRMTTSELREAYLIDNLFVEGEVTLCYTDVERSIVGSVVPVDGALTLPIHKELASDFFAQRREIGVINIGKPGTIVVDGEHYDGQRADGAVTHNWQGIWAIPAVRSVVLTMLFIVLFKDREQSPKSMA